MYEVSKSSVYYSRNQTLQVLMMDFQINILIMLCLDSWKTTPSSKSQSTDFITQATGSLSIQGE